MDKNGELKIERGIPMPKGRQHSKGYGSAIEKLKPTDSVLIPSSVASVHSIAARILGKGNFTCRKEGDGVRIWRIK